MRRSAGRSRPACGCVNLMSRIIRDDVVLRMYFNQSLRTTFLAVSICCVGGVRPVVAQSVLPPPINPPSAPLHSTLESRNGVTSNERASMLAIYQMEEWPVLIDTTDGRIRRVAQGGVKDATRALANA